MLNLVIETHFYFLSPNFLLKEPQFKIETQNFLGPSPTINDTTLHTLEYTLFMCLMIVHFLINEERKKKNKNRIILEGKRL